MAFAVQMLLADQRQFIEKVLHGDIENLVDGTDLG
jgi:hypothetical protein